MKIKKNGTIALCCLFLLRFLDAIGQTSQELGEVVVTASKFEQKKSKTSKPIHVISKEEIENSKGKSFVELLNGSPSLHISGSGLNNGSNASLFMRGGNDGDVLILMDGIPVSDPSQVSSAYDLNLINLSNVERIEVMGGSASTLYGSGASAGVINIISKNSSTEPFSGQASISAGSYKSLRGNAGISGAKDRWNYGFSYAEDYSAGMSAALDTAKIGFTNDSHRLQTFYSNIGYVLGDAGIVKAFYRQSKTYTEYDYAAFTDNPDSWGTSADKSAGLSLKGATERLSWKADYAYSNIKRNFDGSHKVLDEESYNKWSGQIHQTDVYASWTALPTVRLSMGENFIFTQSSQYNYYKSPYWQTEYTLDNANTSTQAVYLLADWAAAKWSIEAGGRFNFHNQYGFYPTYTFTAGYHLNNYGRLWVSTASAFKSPSLYQLYDPMFGNENLKPESTQNIEGGLVWDIFSITLFYRTGKDVITFANNYINQQEQKVKGLETGLKLRPLQRLVIQTDYTYLNGYAQNGAVQTDLYRRPQHSFFLTSGYEWSRRFYTSLSLKVTGACIDPYFNMNTFETEYITLDSYALVNVYGSYSLGKNCRIFADFKNIANKQYTEITGYSTKGFNMNLGVSVYL